MPPYHGAIRYLPKNGNSGVAVLTRSELADFTAHGLGVACVYEAPSADRAGQGFAAGQQDASWAFARMADLGLTRGVYFAVDYDADPAAVLPYFHGANSVPNAAGRVWAYGGYRVITGLFGAQLITKAWQTQAWSGGNVAAGIAALQRIGYVNVGGVQCDHSDIYLPDWGQHNYSDDSGDDMPLSTEDKAWLTTAIRNEIKRGLGNDYDNADPSTVVAAGPPSSRAWVKVRDGMDGVPGLVGLRAQVDSIAGKVGV